MAYLPTGSHSQNYPRHFSGGSPGPLGKPPLRGGPSAGSAVVSRVGTVAEGHPLFYADRDAARAEAPGSSFSVGGQAAEKVDTVDFPVHRSRRGKPVTLDSQRGRVVTSTFVETGPADASTQTAQHDAHNHSLGPGYSPTQIYDFSSKLRDGVLDQMALMDAAGVDRFFWMPIPTNIEGGPAGCCGNEVDGIGHTYYMPDRFRDNRQPLTLNDLDQLAEVKQYYNTSVDWQSAHVWKSLPPDAQRRVLLAVTGINLDDPHGIHLIQRLKREYPGLFHWIGEITVFKEVVDEQNRGFVPRLEVDAAMHKYLRFAARAGMGITLHCDISSARECIRTGEPGGGEYREQLRGLLQAHPDTTVVLAHMGGLGKYSPPPADHVAYLRSLLETCPHLHVDMSWDAVATHYAPHPKPAANLGAGQRAAFDPVADRAMRETRIREMAALIRDYPDRFLMGSDALVSRNTPSLTSTYGIYTNQGQGPGTATLGSQPVALFDYLPQDTLDLVLRGNFDRVYRQAEAASRRYERDGLQRDLDRIQQQAVANGRTPNHWPEQWL